MKKITLIITAVFFTFPVIAQDSHGEHLLDGTTVSYTYENGSSVQAEFTGGQYKYKFVAGPFQGVGGSEKYMSRKVANGIFLVFFRVPAGSSVISLVFNFDDHAIYSSALIFAGTAEEQTLFDAGKIEKLNLQVN